MSCRRTVKGFWRQGEWCELVDPGGPPTGRQLLRLNCLGLLQVVEHPVPPLTKGEAAYAIDVTRDEAA